MGDKDDDNEKGESFWRTFPGYLTGCAAVITAIAGLLAALVAAGIINTTSIPTPGPIIVPIPIIPGFTDATSTSTPPTGPVGAITGRVTMQNGAPVDGAEVWLVDPPALRTNTNIRGEYTFINVPAGSNHVSAQKTGLGATKDVDIQAGRTITVDLTILPLPATPLGRPTYTPTVRPTVTPSPTRFPPPIAPPTAPTPRARSGN